MNKKNNLRDKSTQELEVLLDELNKQLFSLRNENSVQRKLEKPHLMKETKREKARVLTLLREEELLKSSGEIGS